MLLAIETSCDETAVAIFDVEAFLRGDRERSRILRGELLASQTLLHEAYGGVVPELAAREHLGTLPILFERLLEESQLSRSEIRGVAVTRGPGLNGCLLVGLSFAKSFALARRIPLLGLNHLEAHLFAAELEPEIRPVQYPALALLVSGGHTELIFVRSFRNYELVARTRDDAVGEAFDKAATLLSLPYPGGPNLSRLAETGRKGEFRFPLGMKQEAESFSFSGVKTAISRTVQSLGARMSDSQLRADLALAIEESFVEALLEKTRLACKKYRPTELVVTGGVAANRRLRASLEQLATPRMKLRIPEPRWCTDNAAMIGMLGTRLISHDAHLQAVWLEQREYESEIQIGSLPRWPIEQLSV